MAAPSSASSEQPITPHYLLDMTGEQPIVRKATWGERTVSVVSNLQDKFFISKSSLQNIRRQLEALPPFEAHTPDEVRKKWALAHVTLIQTSRGQNVSEATKKELETLAHEIEQHIPVSQYSFRELGLSDKEKGKQLSYIHQRLREFATSMGPDRIDQNFLQGIERLAHETGTPIYDLLKEYLDSMIQNAHPETVEDVVLILINIKNLAEHSTTLSAPLKEAVGRFTLRRYIQALFEFDKPVTHEDISHLGYFSEAQAFVSEFTDVCKQATDGSVSKLSEALKKLVRIEQKSADPFWQGILRILSRRS